MSAPIGFLARVTCRTCGTSRLTETAPEGFAGVTGCNCCPQDHNHVAVSNGCPGAGRNHAGIACPDPDGGLLCTAVTPMGEECPGGHCGLGVEGCQVCPGTVLHIELLSLGGPLTPAGG